MRGFALGVGLSVSVFVAVATPAPPVFSAVGYCPGGPARSVAQKAPPQLVPTVAQTFGVGADAIGGAPMCAASGQQSLGRRPIVTVYDEVCSLPARSRTGK